MIRQLLFKLYFGLQTRAAVYFLVVRWLLVQGYLYHRYGVKLVSDSLRRYLPLTQMLLEGNFHLLNYNSRYLGYLGFLALFLKVGLPYIYIVLAQIIISGLAAIYLYKLSLLLSPNRVRAFLTTFLFIAWKDQVKRIKNSDK